MASSLDKLTMRGLVSAFDKVFYPMGLHGLGTLAAPIAKWRGHPLAEHTFDHGARFLYPNYDSYWANYLIRGRPYEPDIRALLERLLATNRRFAFVDGGANFGFWSCFLSQRGGRVESIVAIEPTPRTFAVLSRNAAVNGDEITCIEAAIAEANDSQLALVAGGSHAGNHVSHIDDKELREKHLLVPSVTVDYVVEQYCRDSPLVMIKLDVEGFEPQALLGARDAICAGNPVIYECHGADRDCSATRAAISSGLDVHFLFATGQSVRIENIEMLQRLKTNPGMGYNLVGVRPGSQFESLLNNA